MRIRSIKPEFWRSEDITRLRRDVRLLFIGLWSYVDDNGVGVDDHRQISADLFALEDDPVGTRAFVRDGLATLSAAGLIARYEHGGKRYLFIPTWDRHQRVDKPGRPRYPRPDESGVTMTDATTSGNTPDPSPVARVSRECRESVAPGTEEQGNRGTGEQETDSTSPSQRAGARDGHGEPQRRDRRDRGTRLPDEFPVTPDMAAWARDNTPDCGTADHEAFCDYWRAQPGAKGRKVDWKATWRNWMRREQDRRGNTHRPQQRASGHEHSTGEQRATQALQAGRELQALADRGLPLEITA